MDAKLIQVETERGPGWSWIITDTLVSGKHAIGPDDNGAFDPRPDTAIMRLPGDPQNSRWALTTNFGVWSRREDALEALVGFAYDRGWTGGYAQYAVDDSDVLCGECARAILREALAEQDSAIEQPDPVVANGDTGLESAEVCDNCGTEIVPEKCSQCFDPIHEDPSGGRLAGLPEFHGENGYLALHGNCLAALVVKGEAEKVGLMKYHVPQHSQVFVGTPH